MQDDDVKRLLDYAVYGPIGILTSVSESLPNAVETGRKVVESKTTMARFIGKMAFDIAGAKAKSQVDDLRKMIVDSVGMVLPEPWGDLVRFVLGDDNNGNGNGNATVGDMALEHNSSETSEAESSVGYLEDEGRSNQTKESEFLDADAVEAVIPNYRTLSATQISGKLDLLSEPELRQVLSYELSHRGRKTIVAKVEKLIAPS